MIYVVGDQKHGHDRDLLHLEPNSYLVQLNLLPHGRSSTLENMPGGAGGRLLENT